MALESPLDCREIKPVNLKGNKFWIFIGSTDAEAPILWPPDVKNCLLRKDPDAGKYWRQEKKGNDRGWVGWMASSTWRTWVWANSGRWWRIGKPGVLQSMGSQQVRHNWATRQQQTVLWLQGPELYLKYAIKAKSHATQTWTGGAKPQRVVFCSLEINSWVSECTGYDHVFLLYLLFPDGCTKDSCYVRIQCKNQCQKKHLEIGINIASSIF